MTTVAFKMLMMKNVLLLTTLSVVHSDDAIAKEDESEEEEKILLTNDDTFVSQSIMALFSKQNFVVNCLWCRWVLGRCLCHGHCLSPDGSSQKGLQTGVEKRFSHVYLILLPVILYFAIIRKIYLYHETEFPNLGVCKI